MSAPKKFAVAGATGRVGRHIVDVLTERGYDAVPIARARGVDVVTGAGLAAALAGVDGIIDAASWPTPEQDKATEFFTNATANFEQVGQDAGVQRLVVVSIIGTDVHTSGYGAAKIVHEQAALSGPIPAKVVRAAQFHEFVEQMLDWGTQGDVGYVPRMRTQLVAARTVAEVLVDVATQPEWSGADIWEVAGPREERLADMATLFAKRRGRPARVEEVSDPADPNHELYANGSLLPNPGAILAGPTFEEWLDETS
jgi:uncharacterized protein YbjT (DUF2867 family)